MPGTMHELVREAGDEAVRAVKKDPNYHRVPESVEKAERVAADPKSEWPEPDLRGEHMQQVQREWMPPLPVPRGQQEAMALRVPNSGGGDMVAGINRGVGHFETNLAPHGGKSRADRAAFDKNYFSGSG